MSSILDDARELAALAAEIEPDKLDEAIQIARELFWTSYERLSTRQRCEYLERIQRLDGTEVLMTAEDLDALYGDEDG